MRILFDNGTPRGLARFLIGHTVEEAWAHGWKEPGDLTVTTDKNIRLQQNLEGRKLALIVLEHAQWPMLKLVTGALLRPSRQPYPAAILRSRFRLT